jgi:ribonuclease HI
MDRVHIYTYTDIRGPRKRTGYYIYLLEQETKKGLATLHKIERIETPETENRVQLLAVIGALRRFWKSSDIVIHTHSEYVAAGFTKGWLEKWVENDWKTGKGEPVSNRPEWEEMAELLNVHEFEFCVGKHTYSNVMAWWIRKVREGYLEIEDIIYGSRNGG